MTLDPRSPHIHLLTPRRRWTWMRKADIVVALRAGLVSVDEVTAAHGLSVAELAEWQQQFAWAGVEGLKYRRPPKQYPRGERTRAA